MIALILALVAVIAILVWQVIFNANLRVRLINLKALTMYEGEISVIKRYFKTDDGTRVTIWRNLGSEKVAVRTYFYKDRDGETINKKFANTQAQEMIEALEEDYTNEMVAR